VFGSAPFLGNPVAVVFDAGDLGTEQMQRIARWTNLSETTFVLPPTADAADYRMRVFTPANELPFAGHPTLGTCHAWLEETGGSADGGLVQQGESGLIRLKPTSDGLALAAPPLSREGRPDEADIAAAAAQLGIAREDVLDAAWADNGPPWLAMRLRDAGAVLAVRPGDGPRYLGLVGPYPPGGPGHVEVRCFFPVRGRSVEDPVTGSLNAAIAPWLRATGVVPDDYVVSQGAATGRAGRVHLSLDGDGTTWLAGSTTTLVAGSIEAS
jgi:predicted PhzF superfamily epimerase YddE/YHI9